MATKSPTPAGSLGADLRYPGWKVVVAGFLIFFFSFGGPTYSMSLLYNEVIAEFGWSRAAATSIYAWKGATGFVVSVFVVGQAVHRFGLKPVFLAMLLLQALGFFWLLEVHSIESYFFAGFLIGLGQGAVLLCVKLLVSRWFTRNVGLAGSLALMGGSFGGMVFTAAIPLLMPDLGWRLTFALIGVGILIISVPLVLLLNDSPTEEDVLPETVAKKNMPTHSAESVAATRAADIPRSYGELMRDPMFWAIVIGVLVISAVDQGLFQNMQIFFVHDVHLSAKTAAWLLSLTATMGLVAKFVAGKFFDVFSVKGIAVWYLMVGVMVLMAFTVTNVSTAVLFVSVLGLAHGGLVCEGPVLAKHVFGPGNMNKVLPILTGCFSLGSSVGPTVLAYMSDVTGHYSLGFTLAATAAVLSAVLLVWLVRPLYLDRLHAATPSDAVAGA